MPEGIIILGSAGSGKTSLGHLVASGLGFAHLDIDDYLWRTDTTLPFSVMYSKSERIQGLRAAADDAGEFVMSGSMNSFHEYFDSMFLLAVSLTADTKLRLKRIHDREFTKFGARILPGGDMYQAHQRFLEDAAGYDHGAVSCNSQQHELWLSQLACPILRLDGGEKLEFNAETVMTEYRKIKMG